jgi:uncharacterized membrane protein YedE/YeeE
MKRSAYIGIMLLAGALFGLILSRSGAADFGYIRAMFLFEDLQLYGILAVAVAVALPGMWILKRRGRSLSGAPLALATKPSHRGNIIGGVLFGAGWAMTGMCPGPIFVNIGEGKLYALGALAGAICGAYAFGRLYPRLQRPLGLPVLMSAGEEK